MRYFFGCILLGFILKLFSLSPVFAADVAMEREPVKIEISEVDESAFAGLTDRDYNTFFHFDKGEINVIPERPAFVLYIVWNEPPNEYSVIADEKEAVINDGFLHKLVVFSERAEKVVINTGGGSICDIFLFDGKDNLPEYVQDWREPCEQADMMVFSAHADDELLMFGGTLPYYAKELGLRVQVVYMTTHWQEQPRPHEALDGLWEAGVENYPVFGIIPDIPYQPIFTLAEAAKLYDFEEVSEWFTEQLRRFKPSVLITHDLKGEYGHAAHKLAAKTASEAVELSRDPSAYPDSAEKYGIWNVPKTYLHFYEENTVEMDWEIPLESYGGITAKEAAARCYKKHKSQQIWGYSVNYGDKWDCRQFGLYRSLVGTDTKADFMENILPISDIPDSEETAENTTVEPILTATKQEEKTLEIPADSMEIISEEKASSKTDSIVPKQEKPTLETTAEESQENGEIKTPPTAPEKEKIIICAVIVLTAAIILVIIIKHRR